jgi:hypothetical protein
MLQSTKSLSFHQHVVVAPPIEAVVAPINLWFLKCTHGNINSGGTFLPMAFTATIIVTFVPLSPDNTLPTCLIPLAEIILRGT